MNLQKIKILAEHKNISIRKLSDVIDKTEQGLHSAIRNNTLKAADLDLIAKALNVSISIFFEENGKGDFSNIKDSTVISSDNSKIISNGQGSSIYSGTSDLESEIKNLETKVNELKQINEFRGEMTANMIDHLTELIVKIVEKDNEMKNFIEGQREMHRLIAQINTFMRLYDNKVFYSKKFFEYFKNPY